MNAALDTLPAKSGRRMGLGSSDAAPALGLSPWKTPLELYMEKIGQAKPSDREVLHLKMGHALEPMILARAEKQLKISISERQRTFVDPAWTQRWTTADGIGSDDSYIEAKSVGMADPAEWGDTAEDDAVPMAYYVQTQHGLACSGKRFAWMPIVVLNREFRIYRIRRDDELIALMTEKERAFVALVEARTPPPVRTLTDVKLRWPSHTNTPIQATVEVAEAVVAHAAARKTIKEAEARKEQLELLIKSHMGEHAELVDVDGNILCTWRQAKASRVFDEEQFALDHPDLHAKYLREKTGSRRFLNKL